jgi:hypothetical protein
VRLALGAAVLLLAAAPAALASSQRGFSPGFASNGHSSPPAAAAPAAPTQSGAGVVQSVSSRAVVLRQLDGSIVSVPLGRDTQILLDGRPARLTDIRPGYVLDASWSAGQPPAALRFERSG